MTKHVKTPTITKFRCVIINVDFLSGFKFLRFVYWAPLFFCHFIELHLDAIYFHFFSMPFLRAHGVKNELTESIIFLYRTHEFISSLRFWGVIYFLVMVQGDDIHQSKRPFMSAWKMREDKVKGEFIE